MRFLMKVSIPNEAGNRSIVDGSLPKTIREILDDQKPEAAYFGESEGRRTGFLIMEMADASQIPGLAEPWFLALNARIEFHPVMTIEDLAKAGPGIDKAVKRFGKMAKTAVAR